MKTLSAKTPGPKIGRDEKYMPNKTRRLGAEQ